MNEPLCRMCNEAGVTRAATVVDHILPLTQGGEDVDENCRSLCDEHHAEVTAEQFGFRKKIEIGTDGWPIEPGDERSKGKKG